MKSLINEETIELACLAQLQALGWQCVDGRSEQVAAWRASAGEVIFREVLAEAVARLNPELSASAVDEVVGVVCRSDIAPLIERNRTAYGWLRNGVRVVYQTDEGERAQFARLVDFQTAANNAFVAVNQLTVAGTKGNRRPDIVLYVNGLPVAVLELKNPLSEQATIQTAFWQLQTYKDEISELFVFNQALVVSDGITARVGSLTADLVRFLPWRVVDEKHGSARLPFVDELQGLVAGLFVPSLWLDYMANFVLFEPSGGGYVKKIAAYHQFYGVNEAVECTLLAASRDGDGRIGVMWHTQGSGKSLSMLFYAAKLLSQPPLQNPTIVVVTDRNDLDGQLFATFSAGQALLRQSPVQADGREALREALASRETGGVIFTTIQKFTLSEGETAHPLLNARKNIIVISDEAHRSQYGMIKRVSSVDKQAQTAGIGEKIGYAQHLRSALPNASFIGFTGTPIELEDRDTQAVFGKYISTYDLKDAVEDGATVPIYYEMRQIRLGEAADFAALMAEADAYDEQNENSTQLRLQERLLGNDSRLDHLVSDFIAHFEQRTALIDGKAMLVAASREIAVRLFDKIAAIRPEWAGDPSDVESGAVKIIMTGSASDPEHFQRHIYGKDAKKRLEARFKDPKDPLKIVIVRDMWLTGFDAPCCHTMYIDKPMKGHNLMQAIARVNRVFANKNGGLVVDYFGLSDELKEATRRYTNARGKGNPTQLVDEAFDTMQTFVSIIHGQFATAVNGQAFDLAAALHIEDEYALFDALQRAANHILALDNATSPSEKGSDQTPRLNEFLRAVKKARQGLNLCATLPKAAQYRHEIAFFDAVRKMLAKDKASGGTDRALQLAQLVDKAITSEGVVDLFAMMNREHPNISLLSDEFLQMVKGSDTPNLWAQALERYVATQISTKASRALAVRADFETRLKQAMNKYHNQSLSVLEVIEELIGLAKQLNEKLARGESLGLTPSELAFYDALIANESAAREMSDETLKALAQDITAQLRRLVTLDWQYKDSVRAKIRLMIKRMLKRYKYPPDKTPAAIDQVIKQAEVIADELSSG